MMIQEGGLPIVGNAGAFYSVLVVWGDNGPLPSVWLHSGAAIFFSEFNPPRTFFFIHRLISEIQGPHKLLLVCRLRNAGQLADRFARLQWFRLDQSRAES